MSVPAPVRGGVVIDGRSRAPIAGAEVTFLGYRGAERTDAAGHFRWAAPPPPAPVTIILILPDGRLARPIRMPSWDSAGRSDSGRGGRRHRSRHDRRRRADHRQRPGRVDDVLCRAPTSTQRAPATLSQALENVPGVSFISEGQGAVPAIRGLARGRSLILARRQSRVHGTASRSERLVSRSGDCQQPRGRARPRFSRLRLRCVRRSDRGAHTPGRPPVAAAGAGVGHTGRRHPGAQRGCRGIDGLRIGRDPRGDSRARFRRLSRADGRRAEFRLA